MGGNIIVTRVLHVIPSLSMSHGGPSRAVRLIERALRAWGAQVETVSTDDDGPGRRLEGPLGAPRPEDGVTRRYFRMTVAPYKISLSLGRWLFGHVREYDIIHIHALFSFSSTLAAWAARRAGVPYVVRPLGTLATYGMKQRRPWLKRLSFASIERPILQRAAAVHFTSDMERDEAALLGVAMRSVVIPLAVEPALTGNLEELLSSFPKLRGKRWVLFLSRLDPKKNVEGLLDAIATCYSEFPGVLWLLAGTGASSYVSELHARAERLGIDHVVLWSGHLHGGQKDAAFTHAEVFVLPSYSENFGIAAAEALQAGLPVILGNGVALATLVAKGGAGVGVAPEPTAIANALRGYLQDAQLRAQAGANAKILAEREFSVGTMGERLGKLYETILSGPRKAWQRQS